MLPVFILDLNDEKTNANIENAVNDDADVRESDVSESDVSAVDIENMVNILDNFASSDAGRLKIKVSDSVKAGKSERIYHHGRCDIGSPFAKGDAFDVLEDAEKGGNAGSAGNAGCG